MSEKDTQSKEGADRISARLEELGIELPGVPEPVAAYVPAVLVDMWVYTSGQLPIVNGKMKYTGILGKDLGVEDAYKAARICCLNALAALNSVIANLDEVDRIIKVTGFVASAPGFIDQPKVVNGASDLLKQIFGDTGKHARSAVGVSMLPLNSPVEVELIARLKP
jgi:enamine deaminase RidA (YjgF/YER057c/UK114 family)